MNVTLQRVYMATRVPCVLVVRHDEISLVADERLTAAQLIDMLRSQLTDDELVRLVEYLGRARPYDGAVIDVLGVERRICSNAGSNADPPQTAVI